MPKNEWIQQKQDFKSKSKSKSKSKFNLSTNVVSSSSSSKIPFLLVSSLQGSESAKDLWRLFSMIGPIRHLEVYKKSNPTEFVNEHSCVVQYESHIVCFHHHHLFPVDHSIVYRTLQVFLLSLSPISG